MAVVMVMWAKLAFGQISLFDPADPNQLPTDVAFAGGFYFSMYADNNRIGKYGSGGNFLGYSVNAPMSSFDEGPGGLWVQLSVNNQLKVYNTSGSNTHSYLGIANASGTAVRDWNSHWSAEGTTVTRYDQNSQEGSYSSLVNAGRAAYDPVNDVLAIADNGAGKVIILTTGNTPTLITEVIVPSVKDVAFDGFGNLLACYPNDVAKYLVSGSGNNVTYGAGSVVALGFLADPVAVDVNGTDIMVAEAGSSGTAPRTRVFLSILPVELVSFTVRAEGTTVFLNWQTVNESRNDGIEIQHYQTGNFEKVGFVKGAGTTSQPQHYDFKISNLMAGTHYFRLKQQDFDGNFEFSPIVTATIQHRQTQISPVTPNPLSEFASVTLELTQDEAITIQLLDLSGRPVKQLYQGYLSAEPPHHFQFDMTHLPAASYWLQVQGESFQEIQKMVLVR